MGLIYLLHFDAPLAHAQHYMGFTSHDDWTRLDSHLAGVGSRLMAAVTEREISWNIVRAWRGERADERRLKNLKAGNRMCPLCAAHPFPLRSMATVFTVGKVEGEHTSTKTSIGANEVSRPVAPRNYRAAQLVEAP